MNRRQALSLMALLGTGTTALTACQEELPELQPTAPATAEPNLDSEQVSAVLDQLTQTLQAADEAKDAQILSERVKQPALNMRSAMYNVSAKTDSAIVPLQIDPNSVTVTERDTWPRAIVAVTKSEPEQLPAVMVVTQEDAHAPYKLETWARLFPGRSVATIAASEGSPVVEADSADYVLSPTQALTAWVGRLDGGEDHADLLGEDDFTTFYQAEAKRLNEGAEAAGKVTFQATVNDGPITGIKLADGTAIVAGSFTNAVTYEKTQERATLKVGGTAAKFLEDPQVHDEPIQITYMCTVMLSLPELGTEGKISALGAERSFTSVTRVEN
ncbi:MAG: hypothetical protein Q4P06_03445 [Actinomycetaceae bacterium]|nr:hypothetical protein [Actinomycetaceae bacterium]